MQAVKDAVAPVMNACLATHRKIRFFARLLKNFSLACRIASHDQDRTEKRRSKRHIV